MAQINVMDRGSEEEELHNPEDTPAYGALAAGGIITSKYRRNNIEDIFTGIDLKANSSQNHNLWEKCKYGYYCCPILGCIAYGATHLEMFVEAGHIGFLMNEKNEYLLAQPGMHNITSLYMKVTKPPQTLRGHIKHGNRTIVVIEQGYVGYATDNGQPVLLPPGIHVWTSESLDFVESHALDDHILKLGPYTLLTVDEGYAAVTQNNGKQCVLPGGHTHLLSHKNWKFEKFMTLKIQTDDLEKIQATSADNINMLVDSTVNWRIVDVEVAATMAAETMSSSGRAGEVSADISKLRRDVLKQALASLAAFIGGVNYSNSFHMSAAAATGRSKEAPARAEARVVDFEGSGTETAAAPEPVSAAKFSENPLYDVEKMGTAVEHANRVTRTYGIEVMSINIISASPCDAALTKSLASGAVASAEALMAETAARGNANAVKISAEAEGERELIEARAHADAELIKARASADAEKMRAEGVAAGLRTISESLDAPGGQKAMVQRLAEQYIDNIGDMAKNAKLIIVPDKPNDISSVLTTALGVGGQVNAQASSGMFG